MICELRHVAAVIVAETTYFVVSLKNGAPGSSSAVRADHAGSNISYVVRPRRMPFDLFVSTAIASPSSDRSRSERPGRRVDDAVEGRELVHEDLAHQKPY